MLVILAFLALIPASKHFHLVAVADHRVPEVARARQPAEPRFREGAGRPRDGQGSRQQERARRVHVRRVRPLPGELSGVGRRQGAEPEDDHPADAGGAARRRARDEARRDLQREGAVAVHDLRRLREPVPGRHRAPADPDRRRAAGWSRTATRPTISARCTTTSSAAATSGASATTSAQKFVAVGRRSRRSIRRSTTCWSGSAAPVSFDADFQKSLRSLFDDPARAAASSSACCRRSGATAIRRSAPATSTCFRSWRTPTSRI